MEPSEVAAIGLAGGPPSGWVVGLRDREREAEGQAWILSGKKRGGAGFLSLRTERTFILLNTANGLYLAFWCKS
jgi:hypothetical protein